MNREFKFYASEELNMVSRRRASGLRRIADRINSDKDLIEEAKEANRKLAESVSAVLANKENAIFSGAMIIDTIGKNPRYVYIKNTELGDVEIDLLSRTFRILDA